MADFLAKTRAIGLIQFGQGFESVRTLSDNGTFAEEREHVGHVVLASKVLDILKQLFTWDTYERISDPITLGQCEREIGEVMDNSLSGSVGSQLSDTGLSLVLITEEDRRASSPGLRVLCSLGDGILQSSHSGETLNAGEQNCSTEVTDGRQREEYVRRKGVGNRVLWESTGESQFKTIEGIEGLVSGRSQYSVLVSE